MSLRAFVPVLRRAAFFLLLAALTACAGGPEPVRTSEPLRPSGNYGVATASDPWGPYIREASERFDVPEAWIRTVIQIESGGRTHLNGKPITSRSGAMGLMQLMPATFAELRQKHGLGYDPHDPYTNIMAGTAYIREMYDLYGSPGFLAAYNCGPRCYGDHLAGARTLPLETRNYLAKGGPQVAGHYPRMQLASAGREQVALAPAPAAAPTPGVTSTPLASPAPTAPSAPIVISGAVPPAKLPVASSPVTLASAPAAPVPATAPTASATPVAAIAVPALGGWGIQVGAFSTIEAGQRAAEAARRGLPDLLAGTQIHVTTVTTSAGVLYRARLIGITESQASLACQRLIDRGGACIRVAAG